MGDGLQVERDGAVLTITLNRPDVHNALDWKTRDALVAALDNASADLAVRAVVLTGAGERAFCTGADLRVPMPAPAKPDGAPDRAQATSHGASRPAGSGSSRQCSTARRSSSPPSTARLRGQ